MIRFDWLLLALAALGFVAVKLWLAYSSRQRRRQASVRAAPSESPRMRAERERLLQWAKSAHFQRTLVQFHRFWCAEPRRTAVVFASDERELGAERDAVSLRLELVLDLGLERYLRLRGLARLHESAQRALAAARPEHDLVLVASSLSNNALLRSPRRDAYACVVVVPVNDAMRQAPETQFDSLVHTVQWKYR